MLNEGKEAVTPRAYATEYTREKKYLGVGGSGETLINVESVVFISIYRLTVNL